ncbi:hypothetical protein PLUTE_b0639 [Pseudoalteromonas luteoviolacea DSM 6061]|nr:hypothetical protein [Pseudoalteromonas luteoviolacea DSM 6061]
MQNCATGITASYLLHHEKSGAKFAPLVSIQILAAYCRLR